VNNVGQAQTFQPGEWHIYLDTPLPVPDTDGSVPILAEVGCTDPAAVNYDPLAEADNGSCTYETVLQLELGSLTPAPSGVHVAGSFQGWVPNGTPLELGEDGVYRVTVVAQVGSSVEYKFLNGDAWGSDEGVPEECGVPNGLGGFNRSFVVPAANQTLDAHCFASCTSCVPAGPLPCSEGECCGTGTVWDAETGTCVADGTNAGGTCVEDLNGDGVVAVADILQLLGAFGATCE